MKDSLRRYISHELLGNGQTLEVTDDENLLGSGLIDSIGMMSLVVFIESELNIDVPPEDVTIEHFLSLNAIDEYLTKRRS